jgi:serine/threonine-protein kinase
MSALRLFTPTRRVERLDRYELLGEIASGGMATVYLARLKGLGGFQRLCAIKCLLPHLATQHDFVDMFLDEARLAAAIRHPNVVSILEVGARSSGHFIVMEYVEGDTLAGLLEHALALNLVVPTNVVLRIGLDMLAGLHAAHELVDEHGRPLNLVHRDVSPQNVLIGIDGIAKITDFGIARATSRLTYTREGQLKGKLAYMAPEYIQGDHEVDRRADVFSAGIVLWEALAMTRLFKSETDAATLARILAAKPPNLHEVAKRIPEKLGRVVMRALERTKTARFSTCAEFAEALEGAATGSARPASPGELSRYIHGLLGDAVQQQRTDVRSCVARFDSYRASQPSRPPTSVSPDFPSIYSSRVTQREATTTISTSRDVPRTSRPISSAPRASVIALSTLLLAVLGVGGGIGAYFGVKASSPLTASRLEPVTRASVAEPLRSPRHPAATASATTASAAAGDPAATQAALTMVEPTPPTEPLTVAVAQSSSTTASSRDARSSRTGKIPHRRTNRSASKSSTVKVPLDSTIPPKNPYR